MLFLKRTTHRGRSRTRLNVDDGPVGARNDIATFNQIGRPRFESKPLGDGDRAGLGERGRAGKGHEPKGGRITTRINANQLRREVRHASLEAGHDYVNALGRKDNPEKCGVRDALKKQTWAVKRKPGMSHAPLAY